MKAAFFMVSVICAMALGLVSYIMATGRIPLRPPPPPAEAADASATPPPFSVAAGEKALVEEMVASLKQERDAYERKRSEMAADYDEEKVRIKVGLLEKLKADLQQMQAKLEDEIRGIQDAERKNLQSIADVYSKMEPANAATLLQKMEKRRAASVLSLMGERQAAAVLDEVAMTGEDARETAVEWADIIRKMKSEQKTATP